MYTREQILKQIEELTLSKAKMNSNARETIQGLAKNDEELINTVLDDLLPFQNGGIPYIVQLGMKIIDDELHQTVNNVLNFYVMVKRDPMLNFGHKIRGGGDIYDLDLGSIVAAGFDL